MGRVEQLNDFCSDEKEIRDGVVVRVREIEAFARQSMQLTLRVVEKYTLNTRHRAFATTRGSLFWFF